MKEKFKKAYIDVAFRFAELSHARRLKVGAIVVKDNRIISIGYNGMPTGWDNDCEDESVELYSGYEGAIHRTVLKTKPEVLHAEMNALMKLARSNESGLDASIFITHSPCMDCAKGIFQAGIKEVYFTNEYRDSQGIDFLKKCGIKVEEIEVEQ
jgi:dCMP deaminase